MNQLILPTSPGRADYLRVLSAVAGAMSQASGRTISQEELLTNMKVQNALLKLPQTLDTIKNTYVFNPVKGVETPIPGELKIDRNDFFAVTHVGLRFTRAQYTSTNQSLSNYGNYRELLYPSPTVFTGAAQAGSGGKNEADCLQTIVRGRLGLSVNNDQQWDIPCSELVYSQEQYATSPQSIVYGPGTEGRGLLHLDSIIILDGNSDNQLQLNLLTGDMNNITGQYDTNGVATTTHRNLIMPVLYGILLKNAAGAGYSFAGKCVP